MSQKEIVTYLSTIGYIVSERHLRRILKGLQLYRRKNYTDIGEVAIFVNDQINTSGKLHGYRWMFEKCIQSGLRVRKEDVRSLISILDPDGCDFRKSRRLRRRRYVAAGPNYTWHIDGYDKIKPYGFAINGCIDGFSRRLIWLNVYTTNNDPRIIAGYFVFALEEHGGCPRIVRADPGTENVRVKGIQQELMGNQRNHHYTSYIEGSSTSNQRIESFWGHLRKQCAEYYMYLFYDLQESGEFTGDFIDKNVLQFCFMSVIQCELDRMTLVWNSHKIRKSRFGLPHGRPNVMFEAPSLYGTHSYINEITPEEIRASKLLCKLRSPIPCDVDIFELCCHKLQQNNLVPPEDAQQALETYLLLRNSIRTDLG